MNAEAGNEDRVPRFYGGTNEKGHMTTTQAPTDREAAARSSNARVNDYIWRFELVRSTLEDLCQLQRDKKSGAVNRRSRLGTGKPQSSR